MAVNYLTLRSTISYATDGSQAPINSLMAVSSVGVTTWTNRIAISTLTASTITASTVSFSTMTASTIITVGSTITLAQNASVPNRYVEIGCDAADSMYFDFHSKDSALPDFSTRIISQGGATTGTGSLNMYASTIGLMGTAGVGIGTAAPSAALHIKNATSAMRITGNLTNASTRPAASTTPGTFEIRGSGAFDNTDDGFLRLSAGGGSTASVQAYIDISGYSTVADMGTNIVFATGAERMRITPGGNVGIGTTNPYKPLHISGSSTGDISALIANTNTALASSASLGFGLWSTSGSGSGTTGFAGQISAICMNAANGNTDMAFSIYTGSSVAPNYTLVERMRITAGGNVLIGTTTIPYYNPRLTVTNTGANEVININSDNPSYNFIRFNTTVNVASGIPIFYVTFYNNGGAIGQIVGNGNGTVAYNSGSDARIKKNIDYNFNGMSIINQLKPAAFSMLPDMSNTIYHGFIAQDVLPLYPQYVTTSSDGRYSMDYSKFSGIIVKGIQEQQTTIANLQSQVTAQSAQLDAQASAISALEARLAAAGL